MRLILVRLSALGDIVHTWPLATALRANAPDMHFSWIVEDSFRSLVEGHPAVDSVFSTSTRRWRSSVFSDRTRGEIGRLKTQLRELSFDLALDAQGTMKSAWICRWIRAERTVGLARPWRREWPPRLFYDDCLSGSPGDHVVDTNLALQRVLGAEIPLRRLAPEGRWFLEKARIKHPDFPRPKHPYILILPGAGREEKVLPITVLAEVARGLDSEGIRPLLAWGPGERERAEEIASRCPAELIPSTSLEELTLWMADARLVVGGDTGPVHLAASIGVPVLSIFLNTDPRRNGPLGPHVKIIDGTHPRPEVRHGSSRARAKRIPGSHEILSVLEDLLHEPRTSGTMAEEMKQ